MGTTVLLFVFASFALLCARVSSSGCNWEPIRLSFASVRGGQQQSASPQLFPDSPCGGNMTRLTCSEGRFPDDFICNTGLMREDPNWEGRSRITSIEVKYDHETEEDCTCFFKLYAEDVNRSNFVIIYAECSRDIPDESLPRFWMSNISSLTITVYPENYTMQSGINDCREKMFIFAREEVQYGHDDRLSIPPPPVRFNLKYYECISGEFNLIYGRDAISFRHDGRRYRPNRT